MRTRTRNKACALRRGAFAGRRRLLVALLPLLCAASDAAEQQVLPRAPCLDVLVWVDEHPEDFEGARTRLEELLHRLPAGPSGVTRAERTLANLVTDAFWHAIRSPLKSRDEDAVAAAAKAFFSRHPTADSEALLGQARSAVQALTAFRAAVAKGAPVATGRTLRLRGVLWTVTGADDATVALECGSMARRVPLAALPAPEAAGIARWDCPTPQREWSLAWAYVVAGEWQLALQHAAGAPKREQALLFERVTDWRDRQARGHLHKARTAMANDDLRAAKAALSDLTTSCPGAHLVLEQRPWINEVMRMRPAAPPRAGKPEETGWVTCRRCKGKGQVRATVRRISGGIYEYFKKTIRCPTCNGRRREYVPPS